MATLDSLGQTKVPSVFAKLQAKGLCELMDITGETTTKDAYGSDVKSSTTPYADIPVTWEQSQNGRRVEVAGKPVAYGNYKFTFPVYHEGERINLTAGHKLKVLERGDEPEKTFSIVEIFDNQGVTWEVEARKES